MNGNMDMETTFLLKNITRLQVLHKNTLMGVSEVRLSFNLLHQFNCQTL